jgi:hypothetical protein
MSDQVQVRGPDGQMFRFPASMPQEQITGVLDQHYGRAPAPPSRQQMGRLEAASEGFADGFSLGFNDEAQGLMAAAQADTRPRWIDRFRDDQGNMFTDALGMAGDILTAGSPMTRAGVQMATGRITPAQQQAYESARDSRRDSLEQARQSAPLSTIGGAVGGGILNAAMTGGASAFPSIGRAAAVGAGYGGVYGIGSGEGTIDRAIQGGQGALFGGVTGAATQGLMNAGGAAVRRLFGTSRPSTSQIDDALTRGQIDDATAQRLRDADDLGIELTRGQQTGDRAQIAFEEAARRRSVGSDAASQMVEGFDDTQRGQIGTARQRIADSMSPTGTRVVDDTMDATGFLQQRLQEAERSSRRVYDDAYAVARQSDTVVETGAVQEVGRRVRQTLSAGDNPVIVDDLTPRAARALQTLDELSAMRIRNDAVGGSTALAADDMTVAGVRIQGLERVRQRLVDLQRGAQADPQDRRAMRAVISSFDDWLDDAANARLLEGTDDGIAAYQQARALFRQHRQQFGTQGRRDEAGRLIEEMVARTDGERLPQIANAIFGRASSGEGRASLQMAERVRQIFGPDSQEMGSLRQGLFARVMGLNGDQPAGTDAIVRNLNVLLNGNGRAMASRLYTPEQISRLRRFYGVLRSVQTPRDLTNPSGTAGRLIRQHSRGLLQSLTGRGIPIAGETVNALVEAIGGAGARSQARQALRGVLVPQGVRVPGAVAGVAGYSGSEALIQ